MEAGKGKGGKRVSKVATLRKICNRRSFTYVALSTLYLLEEAAILSLLSK